MAWGFIQYLSDNFLKLAKVDPTVLIYHPVQQGVGVLHARATARAHPTEAGGSLWAVLVYLSSSRPVKDT